MDALGVGDQAIGSQPMPTDGGPGLSKHGVEVCPANRRDEGAIKSVWVPPLQVAYPASLALERHAAVGSHGPRVEQLHPFVIPVPGVPVLVHDASERERPLAKALVALRMPGALASAKPAPGVPKVCAEQPLHRAHW